MEQRKNLGKDVIYIVLVFMLLWVFISITIQAFKCQKMTNTELFLNIPNSVMGNWQCRN